MFSLIKKFLIKNFGLKGSMSDAQMLLFLCNNEALPNPLDAEEEQAYLIRLQNGDEAAKNELIERNLRLVVYIAKKFENTGIELEDLISVGSIGLIKAINTFKMDKKIKLATYASRCIENEILMYLRKVSKQRKETSLETPLSFDSEGNELLLCDVIGVDADEVFKNVEINAEKEMIYRVLDKLNEREQNRVYALWAAW